MKTLQKGEDKIQQICDKLRLETLEPAKHEAHQIIEEAKSRAEQIISDARLEVESYHEAARKQIEQERNVFESSLEQAGQMAVEKLRQAIENRLIREDLFTEVEQRSSAPDVVGKILNALIEAVEKEGISGNLEATIPAAVSVDELTAYLTEKTRKQLQKENIQIGGIKGGVQLKLRDKRMTLDMSEEVLQSLIRDYIGSAFRERLFVIS